MKKYAINRLTIEIGRWCNMTCRHCLKGNREKIACKPEYVDKFLDNISVVNHLYFCGGESSFYIDEMIEILEVFKRKKVQLNYIRVHSNILSRNKKFIDFMNSVGSYSNNPNDVKLFISKDRYHLENMRDMGIDIQSYEETKQWYRDNLIDNIILRENADPEWRILLEGNAKNLPIEELKTVTITQFDYEACKNIPLVPKTIKENSKDVILENSFENMTLSAEGYLYPTYDYSYDTQRKNNYELSIGHVANDSLEHMLEVWNKRILDSYTKNPTIIVQNGLYDIVKESTSLNDKVREVVNHYDNDGLLKLKIEAEELMEKYKKELDDYTNNTDFEVENSMMFHAFLSVSTTLSLIKTLLEIPNGFWRKMGMFVVDNNQLFK